MEVIEHGSFTPLVFSASGGMGPTARVFYKKLASMIAVKHNKAYSKTLNWMRCRISFSLLRSAVMCLRGSRSSRGRPVFPMVGEILKLDLLKVVSDSKSLTIFFEVNCLSILFLSFCVLVYSLRLYFLFDMEEVRLTSVVLQTGSVYNYTKGLLICSCISDELH